MTTILQFKGIPPPSLIYRTITTGPANIRWHRNRQQETLDLGPMPSSSNHNSYHRDRTAALQRLFDNVESTLQHAASSDPDTEAQHSGTPFTLGIPDRHRNRAETVSAAGSLCAEPPASPRPATTDGEEACPETRQQSLGESVLEFTGLMREQVEKFALENGKGAPSPSSDDGN